MVTGHFSLISPWALFPLWSARSVLGCRATRIVADIVSRDLQSDVDAAAFLGRAAGLDRLL